MTKLEAPPVVHVQTLATPPAEAYLLVTKVLLRYCAATDMLSKHLARERRAGHSLLLPEFVGGFAQPVEMALCHFLDGGEAGNPHEAERRLGVARHHDRHRDCA